MLPEYPLQELVLQRGELVRAVVQEEQLRLFLRGWGISQTRCLSTLVRSDGPGFPVGTGYALDCVLAVPAPRPCGSLSPRLCTRKEREL